jgi:hypothetical protein
MDQEFSELTLAETAWLDDLLAGLRRDGVDPLDLDALTRYYDDNYAAWLASGRQSPDPNLIINRVGAGLGECLRSRLPLQWVVVTDQWGTDLAVHGHPGNVVMTPMTMIGKRWSDGETGFVADLARGAVEAAAEIIRDHG